MNLTGLVGRKLNQTQTFLEDGTRVPLTSVRLSSNVVSQIKTMDRDGYMAVKLGFDITNKANKPTVGIAQKAGLQQTPRFFREIRMTEQPDMEVAAAVNAEEVFEAGDIVNVTGTSKGKGYAGVVKRHHFRGGPRTHGQSDRERAPGSIGQTTTPGRVYKGKRMAGRMGNEQVTVKNLMVLDIVDGIMYIKGLIPGPRGSVVMINRVGKNKKFVPIFKPAVEEPVTEEVIAEDTVVSEPVEETNVEETVIETPVIETPEETTPAVEDVSEPETKEESQAEDPKGVEDSNNESANEDKPKEESSDETEKGEVEKEEAK